MHLLTENLPYHRIDQVPIRAQDTRAFVGREISYHLVIDDVTVDAIRPGSKESEAQARP